MDKWIEVKHEAATMVKLLFVPPLVLDTVLSYLIPQATSAGGQTPLTFSLVRFHTSLYMQIGSTPQSHLPPKPCSLPPRSLHALPSGSLDAGVFHLSSQPSSSSSGHPWGTQSLKTLEVGTSPQPPNYWLSLGENWYSCQASQLWWGSQNYQLLNWQK